MKFAKTYLLTMALCLAAGTAAGQSAPVYKWVDGDGVTHYGSQPPNGSNFEVTSVRAKRTNKPALQSRLTNQSDLFEAKKIRKADEAEQASEDAAQRKEIVEERAVNCEKARNQKNQYETSPRLYRPLPNGDREYLSEDELDAERANALRQVREWCD